MWYHHDDDRLDFKTKLETISFFKEDEIRVYKKLKVLDLRSAWEVHEVGFRWFRICDLQTFEILSKSIAQQLDRELQMKYITIRSLALKAKQNDCPAYHIVV